MYLETSDCADILVIWDNKWCKKIKQREFIHDVKAYVQLQKHLKGCVKEPNKFHIYETEKITRKASDAAEYIELFGSFTRDRHARRI